VLCDAAHASVTFAWRLEGVEMTFVQIVEFRTNKIDKIRKIDDEWTKRAGTETTARRGVLCEDRDNPGRHLQIVFFDSYESAMKNSELPITQEFGERMSALAEGPAMFHNLNVLEDRTW
jgi:hypothetical protein